MAVNLGALVAKRLARVYARIGQTMVVTGSFGSAAFTGRVSNLVFEEQAGLFTSTETASWLRPAKKVQVAGDFRPGGGPAVGDTVIIADDGGAVGATLVWTVRRVRRDQFADTVYRTNIYISRT